MCIRDRCIHGACGVVRLGDFPGGKSAAGAAVHPQDVDAVAVYAAVSYTHLCKECKAVYEKYQKIFFKKTKEKFKQEHPEVARYAKAAAYLAKHPDDKDLSLIHICWLERY